MKSKTKPAKIAEIFIFLHSKGRHLPSKAQMYGLFIISGDFPIQQVDARSTSSLTH